MEIANDQQRPDIWQKHQLLERRSGIVIDKLTKTDVNGATDEVSTLFEYRGTINVRVGNIQQIVNFPIPAATDEEAFRKFKDCATEACRETERKISGGGIVIGSDAMLKAIDEHKKNGTQQPRRMP